MENLNVSRATALTGPYLGDRVSRHLLGIPAYLRGRIALMTAVAALGAIGLFAGWQWFGAAAMLPLLYTVPCAAMMMMMMCMRGGTDNAPASPNNSADPGADNTL
jgi:hypothetical protein